jgi:DNA (cytosine-5)-methyltransferase 1
MSLRSVELFTGAGGLAMGLELAGFEHMALIEKDKWACDSIRENSNRGHPLAIGWPISECDVRDFDYYSLGDNIDLRAPLKIPTRNFDRVESRYQDIWIRGM